MRGLALALVLAATPAAADTLTGPAKVIDGDSILVAAREIRLAGIDAPERDQTCPTPHGPLAAGRKATAWLKAHLTGKTVTCAPEGRDVYKRTLATCHVDGANLNAAIVAAGWARAYARYSTRYIAEETAAQSARRGIWIGDCEAPWDHRHNR